MYNVMRDDWLFDAFDADGGLDVMLIAYSVGATR